MRLLTIGPATGKFATVAADPQGWVCCYQDEAHGDLVLVQLTPEGERRVPDVRIEAFGGNAFPVLYVDAQQHTWLTFRREPHPDPRLRIDWPHGGILRNLTTGAVYPLGPVYGNNPIALGSGRCWWQSAADFRLSFCVLNKPSGIFDVTGITQGRPTGIAGVDEREMPILVDDVRLREPGMVNPQYAGDCVVGESASGIDRAIARKGQREVSLWPGQLSFTPKVSVR